MKFNPRRLAWVAKRSFPLTVAVSVALFAAGAWVDAWADTPAKKKGDAGAVTVDFSVLGDGTPGFLGAPLPGSGSRRLLMPGVKSPRSQLHVSPVKPSRRARPPRKAPSSKVAAAPSPPPQAQPKAAPAPPAMPVSKVEAAPPPPPPKAEKPPASLAVPEQEGVAIAAIETPAPEPSKTEPEKTQPENTVASAPPPPPPALTPPEPPKEPEATAAPPPEKVTEQVAEKAPEPAPAPPPPPTPTPEPAAETEKPAEPAPTEKAALTPPAMTLEPGRILRVEFDVAQSKVPAAVKPRLEELAAKLKDQPALRVQILAYAGGGDLSAGKARRLSLSRALSVRSFLIGKEIRSTRIDVRALGNKTTEKPLNRVDINITER